MLNCDVLAPHSELKNIITQYFKTGALYKRLRQSHTVILYLWTGTDGYLRCLEEGCAHRRTQRQQCTGNNGTPWVTKEQEMTAQWQSH